MSPVGGLLLNLLVITLTIVLIILLYYNKYNIRFFLPIILITTFSIYISYKLIDAKIKANEDGNKTRWNIIRLLIIIKIFVALWCVEHDIIIKGFGMENYTNYINNILFINNRKL